MKINLLKIILLFFIFGLFWSFNLLYNQNKGVLAQTGFLEEEKIFCETEIPIGETIDKTENFSQNIINPLKNILDNGISEINNARKLIDYTSERSEGDSYFCDAQNCSNSMVSEDLKDCCCTYIDYYDCSGCFPCPPPPPPEPENGGNGGNSCPFIYSWNGQNYIFDSEGITQYFLPEWEGKSYARLPNLKSVENKLKIKISEELEETTFINQVKLYAVSHPKTTEVYYDSSDNLYLIENLIKPISCLDNKNKDCLKKILEKDDIFWNDENNLDAGDFSDLDGDNIADSIDPNDLYTSAIITFPKNNDYGKLLYRSKEFESQYKTWSAILGLLEKYNLTQEYAINGEILNWILREGFLWLDLWDGEKWMPQHFLVEGGTSTLGAETIFPLDLSKIEENVIKIRFRGAPTAAGLDYVYIDYSPDEKLELEELSLSKAEFEENSIINDLLFDDGNYLRLNSGQFVKLEFKDNLVSDPNKKTTFMLLIKGYHIADPKEDYFGYSTINETKETLDRILEEPGFAPRYFGTKFYQSQKNETEKTTKSCSDKVLGFKFYESLFPEVFAHPQTCPSNASNPGCPDYAYGNCGSSCFAVYDTICHSRCASCYCPTCSSKFGFGTGTASACPLNKINPIMDNNKNGLIKNNYQEISGSYDVLEDLIKKEDWVKTERERIIEKLNKSRQELKKCTTTKADYYEILEGEKPGESTLTCKDINDFIEAEISVIISGKNTCYDNNYYCCR